MEKEESQRRNTRLRIDRGTVALRYGGVAPVECVLLDLSEGGCRCRMPCSRLAQAERESWEKILRPDRPVGIVVDSPPYLEKFALDADMRVRTELADGDLELGFRFLNLDEQGKALMAKAMLAFATEKVREVFGSRRGREASRYLVGSKPREEGGQSPGEDPGGAGEPEAQSRPSPVPTARLERARLRKADEAPLRKDPELPPVSSPPTQYRFSSSQEESEPDPVLANQAGSGAEIADSGAELPAGPAWEAGEGVEPPDVEEIVSLLDAGKSLPGPVASFEAPEAPPPPAAPAPPPPPAPAAPAPPAEARTPADAELWGGTARAPEYAAPPDPFRGRRIGEVLTRMGKLTQPQVESVIQRGKASGERFGRILLKEGLVTPVELCRALALQSGLPMTDLSDLEMTDSLLQLFSPETRARHLIVPFDESLELVCIAAVNPLPLQVLAQLEAECQRKIEIFLAPEDRILTTLDKMGPQHPRLKRKHLRYRILLEVSFLLCNRLGRYVDERVYTGRTRDVSEGGFLVQGPALKNTTPDDLKRRGICMQLTIHAEGGPLEMLCGVRFIKEGHDDPPSWQYGLQLLEASDAIRRRLKELCLEIGRERAGDPGAP